MALKDKGVIKRAIVTPDKHFPIHDQKALNVVCQAIEIVKPGLHIGDIGAVIQEHAHNNNFSVVKDYCGHGIGREFHESPQILHYGTRNTGMELQEGMTFTIEPMINVGKDRTKLLGDGWTVITQDRTLSAQWEHTILVSSDSFEILTITKEF